jgi:hypothetical protein
MCFRPFKVSEDLTIRHEAEEMASHAAGRKYNVTSGERGGRKKTLGNPLELAIQMCSIKSQCQQKSLHWQMPDGIQGFKAIQEWIEGSFSSFQKLCIRKNSVSKWQYIRPWNI